MESVIEKLVNKITNETSTLIIADLLAFLGNKGLLTDSVAAALACETYKDLHVAEVLSRVGAIEASEQEVVQKAPSRKGKKKNVDAPTHTSDLLNKEDYLL